MAFKLPSHYLKTQTVSIKHMIHRNLAGKETPRPHSPLRASDLLSEYTFCPREHAFMDKGLAQKQVKFVGTSQRMTYDHGHYMEAQIRNTYLRKEAVGNWLCESCGMKHPTFGKEPKDNCQHCDSYRWEYVEPRFESAYAGVSGGVDLIVDTGQPKYRPIEIKTMAPDDFKSLAAPLGAHKWRTSLYLYLIALSDESYAKKIDNEGATILYVMKSFGVKDTSMKEAGISDAPFSPFKEFHISRDDEALKTPLAKARVLKLWRENPGQGMPCGICPNVMHKRAQECPALKSCFSGKFLSTMTWMENGYVRHPGKTVVAE